MSWLSSRKLSEGDRDRVRLRLRSELDTSLALGEGETIARMFYCQFVEYPNQPDRPPGVSEDTSRFGLLVVTDRRLIYFGIMGLKGPPEDLRVRDLPTVDAIEMRPYDEVLYESISDVEFASYTFGTLILTAVGRHGDHSHRHQFSGFREIHQADFRALPVPDEQRLGEQVKMLISARVHATGRPPRGKE